MLLMLNNLDKVVQYHRRMRLHIAPEPGSSTRASRGGVKDNSPVKPQPELDICQMGGPRGLAASHSRQRHRGGAQRNGRHQSAPDFGDASRHSLPRRALGHAAGVTQVSAGNPNGTCLRRGRPVPAEVFSLSRA